jgi:hypothetical protein
MSSVKPVPLRRLTLLFLLAIFPTLAGADEPKTDVARALSGILIHRDGNSKTWQVLGAQESIRKGELLLGFPDGALASANGAVHLVLTSNFARRAPYPIHESAVSLAAPGDMDMDLFLDRGRIDLENVRSEGAAHVRIRFRHETWELTLGTPHAQVALEIYGRWPQGAHFVKSGNAAGEPAADLVLLVVKGQALVKAGGDRYGMRAPPGPALLHWVSQAATEEGPKQLAELPGWTRADPIGTPESRERQATLDLLRERLRAGTPIGTVLLQGLHAGDATVRRMAVFGLGAVDDLSTLVDLLADGLQADIRNWAVVALRHWIGRGAGQDQRLFEVLVHEKKIPTQQAEIVMQLLHSFDQQELARPATYEVLIDYLLHEQPAVRQLAYWHLVRLVPAGASIPFNAAGSERERQQAHERWKQLIPNGKLPPKRA